MMQTGTAAIAFKNLTRDFPIGQRGFKLRALEAINLEIPPRGIFGLLGPNGSGKSTAIKLILGLLKPSDGCCEVFGEPAGSLTSRKRIGYLPENPRFHNFLTGRELVRYFAVLSGMGKEAIREQTEKVINQVGMEQGADRKVKTYSKGMLQRIGLAQALVHDPDILVLDEPLSGLDPQGTSEVMDLLKAFGDKGKLIVICSHLLTRIEEVCDRVAILYKGKLVVEGTLDVLLGGSRDTKLLKVSGEGVDPAGLAELLANKGLKLEGVQDARRPLDEWFLQMINQGEGKAG
jgi:ABC-2 type transport system ATP-binding protein